MKKYFLFITIILSVPLYGQNKKVADIPLPQGYERIKVQEGSFAAFLRNFPLSDDNTVYYYTGEPASDQSYHYAVLNIDVGKRDLQQCADAVMRLRAEYLFRTRQYSKIHFNFLSDGKPRYYLNYSGNDRSYSKFRKYMNYIFAYANTASLRREMKSVSVEDIQIGDVFIQKGRPYGHAVIVMDMAKNKTTGQKIFLLAQSFMPAQSVYILVNYENNQLSPWFVADFGKYLRTPLWTFTKDDLKHFEDK